MQAKITPNRLVALALGVFALGTTPALAEDDCSAPRGSWQPREAAQAKAESMGWVVRRVRSDDGCFVVYARDPQGNRIEAGFDPATLQLRSIKVKFAPGQSLDTLCSAVCAQPLNPDTAPAPATAPTEKEPEN